MAVAICDLYVYCKTRLFNDGIYVTNVFSISEIYTIRFVAYTLVLYICLHVIVVASFDRLFYLFWHPAI